MDTITGSHVEDAMLTVETFRALGWNMHLLLKGDDEGLRRRLRQGGQARLSYPLNLDNVHDQVARFDINGDIARKTVYQNGEMTVKISADSSCSIGCAYTEGHSDEGSIRFVEGFKALAPAAFQPLECNGQDRLSSRIDENTNSIYVLRDHVETDVPLLTAGLMEKSIALTFLYEMVSPRSH